YLMRFFKELALSRYKYRMLTYPWWQRPAATVGYMGSDLAKLTRSLIAYYASSNHSLSLRCRLHMQKYLLISPLYVGLMRGTQPAHLLLSAGVRRSHSERRDRPITVFLSRL